MSCMFAHQRLLSTWIAIWAMVLNALVPTLSLALDTSRAEPTPVAGHWIEVCSVSGSLWVLLDADGQWLAQSSQRPEGTQTSAHDGHCPYCLTHAASFGLPPASISGLTPWPGLLDRSSQAGAPVPQQLVWLTPGARAPPQTA